MNGSVYAINFDNSLKKYGGIFKPRHYELKFFDLQRKLAEAIIKNLIRNTNFNQKIPLIINFDFINNSNFIACAIRDKDIMNLYHIGVSYGAILLLDDLFSTLLSYPAILPHIGNPESETVVTPSIRNYYIDWNDRVDFGVLDDQEINPCYPKDEERVFFARNQMETALGYLILHEFTHITHGHIDYLNDKKILNLYEEIEVTASIDNISMVNYAFEWEADYIGISRELELILQSLKIPMPLPKNLSFRERKFSILLYNWCYTILTLFRIRLALDPSISSSGSATHPSIAARITQFFNTLDSYLKQYHYDEGRNKNLLAM